MQSDKLDMLLASHYAPQDLLLKLHLAVLNLSLMHTRQMEEAHLCMIVGAILPPWSLKFRVLQAQLSIVNLPP
jgi:hypothetical protein